MTGGESRIRPNRAQQENGEGKGEKEKIDTHNHIHIQKVARDKRWRAEDVVKSGWHGSARPRNTSGWSKTPNTRRASWSVEITLTIQIHPIPRPNTQIHNSYARTYTLSLSDKISWTHTHTYKCTKQCIDMASEKERNEHRTQIHSCKTSPQPQT